MLDQSKLISSLAFSTVTEFFQFSLELMDGDVGASQETVKLLATDPGLNFVKAVTDRHVQQVEACSIQSRVRIWTEQMDPFFRLLTHPRVLDSSVLEQQVATLYSFLLGVNASRMQRVFGFIADLVVTCSSSASFLDTGASPTTIVELSLSVLSRIIDCNTTNILNDSFHSVTETFAGLFEGSEHPVNDFSRLQSVKHIEYLRRRLGIGQHMHTNRQSPRKAVTREAFVLRRDLPGELSADGPRHDNDHAEISQIAILPTYQEITTPRMEYLPTTNPAQWHIQGIRGRLDREFRLLREDTVGQLRDAVRHKLDGLHSCDGRGNDNRRPQSGARTTTYEDAIVSNATLDKNKGLELTVACQQPEHTRIMSDKERIAWWDQSKRLQPGALVCVMDAVGMIQFCVVAESTQRTGKSRENKWNEGTTQGVSSTDDGKDLTLSTDRDILYVRLNLATSSEADLENVLQWYRDIDVSPPRRFLVEFPGVLLASFKHTLEALQSLSQKPDLPFVNLIAPEEQVFESGVDIAPPLFARAPGFSFNLKCLTNGSESLQTGLAQPVPPEQVAVQTGLDLTQSEALLNTLSREVSLIQGPPGTGKSFTGEKIIQVLLSNKDKARIGPIICVCYTNHALDQLLEHLLDNGMKDIIRIGSRSKSERLERLNLRVISDQMELTKAEKRQLFEAGRDMKALEAEADAVLSDLSDYDSLASVSLFLESFKPHFHNQLFGHQEPFVNDDDGWETVGQKRAKNVVSEWLSGGSPVECGPRGRPRTIQELQSVDLEQMSHSERSRVHQDWLKSVRDGLIADMKRLSMKNTRKPKSSAIKLDRRFAFDACSRPTSLA